MGWQGCNTLFSWNIANYGWDDRGDVIIHYQWHHLCKKNSHLISINLQMTQYTWNRCCLQNYIVTFDLIGLFLSGDWEKQSGVALDHLTAKGWGLSWYMFFFFGKKQSSIHCTHSVPKVPALKVHHLHPLEHSLPDLKFVLKIILFITMSVNIMHYLTIAQHCNWKNNDYNFLNSHMLCACNLKYLSVTN